MKYRGWTIKLNGCYCATNPNYADSDTLNAETIEDLKVQIDDEKANEKEQHAMQRAMDREYERTCKRIANGRFK